MPEIMETQRHLKTSGLIILIALLDMLVPLSTDLYLPALAHMREHFQTTENLLGLTLTGFFLFYAVGVLIFGPLSDKFGRKPVLLFGLVLFSISSLSCAFAKTVHMLIICRIIQALGSGSLLTVTTAVVKDSFNGKTRNVMYATIQIMTLLAPMLAPIIGAFVLKFAPWQLLFVILSLLGIFGLVVCLFFHESLPNDEKTGYGIFKSICRLKVVAKNVGFMVYLNTFAMTFIPFMAYLTLTPYVYIKYFHLSPQMFSFFFSSTTMLSAVGCAFYLKICKKVNHVKLINTCLGMCIVSGILMLAVGKFSPFLFLASWVPYKLAGGILRPCNTSILMEQQDGDSGSASSLINATFLTWGSVGMMVSSLFKFTNLIKSIGVIIIVCTLAAATSWFFLLRSKILIRGIK